MATGRVKWFNDRQGYGYIEDSRTGLDVYVHSASIDHGEGLRANILVDYELIETRNGPEALRVRVQQHRR